MRLKDKVAIVTGSASGIGKAIATRFAKEGATVVVADINETLTKSTVDELTAAGGQAVGLTMDVTKRDVVARTMNTVAEKHKRIDILVNNAGISRHRPFATISDEDWDLVLAVDLKGVFFCSQAAAPHMIRQTSGKIVNISSSLGTGASPHATAGSPGGSSAYAAAKAGVIQLTKTLARELGPHGVNVNCVAPGTFLTPQTGTTRSPKEVEEHLAHRKTLNVMHRIGELHQIASAVLFLASDEADYISGHTLLVDGGRTDRM